MATRLDNNDMDVYLSPAGGHGDEEFCHLRRDGLDVDAAAGETGAERVVVLPQRPGPLVVFRDDHIRRDLVAQRALKAARRQAGLGAQALGLGAQAGQVALLARGGHFVGLHGQDFFQDV